MKQLCNLALYLISLVLLHVASKWILLLVIMHDQGSSYIEGNLLTDEIGNGEYDTTQRSRCNAVRVRKHQVR